MNRRRARSAPAFHYPYFTFIATEMIMCLLNSAEREALNQKALYKARRIADDLRNSDLHSDTIDRLRKAYSDVLDDPKCDYDFLVDCVTQEFGEIALEFARYIRRIECDRENCAYHDQITEYRIIREIADQYYEFVIDETTNEDLLTYVQDEDLTDIFDEWIYFFTH